MKSLLNAVAIAALVAVPAVSFAQTSQPVTRADVKQELTQLRQAGYNPNDYLHYPENLQAAEARVDAQQAAYGAGMNGSSQSGK